MPVTHHFAELVAGPGGALLLGGCGSSSAGSQATSTSAAAGNVGPALPAAALPVAAPFSKAPDRQRVLLFTLATPPAEGNHQPLRWAAYQPWNAHPKRLVE